MSVNKDYKDLFRILNENKVKYLVVGAYAVTYYAEPRYTKDIDVWVEASLPNAKKAWKALAEFGAPLKDIKLEDFCKPNLIYQIGIEPNRIDIMMGVPGIEFSKSWQNKAKSTYGGEKIYILGIKELIKAKIKSNRAQDKLDLKKLRKITKF